MIVVAASLGNMMGAVFFVLAATWIKKGHGAAGAWSAILIAGAVGGLVAGVVALRIKPRRPLLVACIVWAPSVASVIFLALELPWETLVIASLIGGFGGMLFNTLWETTLQQHVPATALSRVSAYDWFGSLLCQPLGLAFAGVAAAAIGMSGTLWIAAAVEILAIVAMLATPSVRQLRAAEAG
jgi:MFS family permease